MASASPATPRVAWSRSGWQRELPGNLFRVNTTRYPYQGLAIALGLLVEHALPGRAVVYGDFSPHDGEQAKRAIAAILGDVVDLPVVTDVHRLRQRLAPAFRGRLLEKAVETLGPPDPREEGIDRRWREFKRTAPGERVLYELEHDVRACRDPYCLALGTRQVLRKVIESIHEVAAHDAFRERIARWDAQRTREEIAHAAPRNLRWFTSMA